MASSPLQEHWLVLSGTKIISAQSQLKWQITFDWGKLPRKPCGYVEVEIILLTPLKTHGRSTVAIFIHSLVVLSALLWDELTASTNDCFHCWLILCLFFSPFPIINNRKSAKCWIFLLENETLNIITLGGNQISILSNKIITSLLHVLSLQEMWIEKRLTGKTFGAEIHGFTGPEETDKKINVKDDFQKSIWRQYYEIFNWNQLYWVAK